MMDTAQILLLVVVTILTAILVVLAVQIFLILREFKHTVSKANKVLDETGVITEHVSKPLSSLATLAQGIKTGSSIASFIKNNKGIISKFLKETDE